jgi:hypothetical protein
MITRRKLLYWLGLAPAASVLPVDKFGSANVLFDGPTENIGKTIQYVQYVDPTKWTIPEDWNKVYIECVGYGGGNGGGGGNATRMEIRRGSGESTTTGIGGAGRKLAKGEPDVSE